MAIKVKNVMIASNGLVACFDENDEQVLGCQGFILDIGERLKQCCDEDTKWEFGGVNQGIIKADFSWYWMKEDRTV